VEGPELWVDGLTPIEVLSALRCPEYDLGISIGEDLAVV
jgi:hypothetical protein